MVPRHIFAALSETFSVKAIMTDGYVEEDSQHGQHTRHITILWIFTC
jgi:hypothetical protein